MLKKVLLFGLGGAAALVVGILIGHFGIQTDGPDAVPDWVAELSKDVDESLIEKFIAEVDNIQIQENLR